MLYCTNFLTFGNMLTELQIRAFFKNFNELYFNNELPYNFSIEFKFVKKYLGQFHWEGRYANNGTCVIRFSTAWQMTDFEMQKVLIHEMIHMWQWVHNYNDHHGRSFKTKAAIINMKTQSKYAIARCTNIENKVCLKDKKKEQFKGYIVTYKNHCYPGAIFVARLTDNSIKKIKKWFGLYNLNLYDIKYCIAQGEIYNDYVKSIVRVHGYKYSASDFKKKIESTIIREVK